MLCAATVMLCVGFVAGFLCGFLGGVHHSAPLLAAAGVASAMFVAALVMLIRMM